MSRGFIRCALLFKMAARKVVLCRGLQPRDYVSSVLPMSRLRSPPLSHCIITLFRWSPVKAIVFFKKANSRALPHAEQAELEVSLGAGVP